ncbi:probable WRKY transcription factor 53 [Chenopodium quinoa]|uniref:probable WRKY transcription factor 53 n=1 Tax=Chenopodium quinoa TaxID=63459 RepID=UPI000B791856|nr:probable WRKY transcription factor 53 [Chenopodium quinoa]
MEKNNEYSEKGELVNELVEGRDLTKQLLLMILNNEQPRSSSSNDDNGAYGWIAQKILANFERSLQILQYDPSNNLSFEQTTTDSPYSFSGSPKSQDSDNNGDFKHPFDLKNDPKKLRVIPQVTQRVQGCTKNGLEGPIEDGFSWRKYGEKDILEAKFPRAYFRCNQRTLEGCFATKLVQRTEDGPAFFQVIYRGMHTCSKASFPSFPTNPTQKPESIEIIAYPPCQQSKETMLFFEKDIKPFSSNSSTVLQTHHHINHSFSTNTITSTFQSPSCSEPNLIDFNNYRNETVYNPQDAFVPEVVTHMHPSSSGTHHYSDVTPHLSFDQVNLTIIFSVTTLITFSNSY